MEGPRPSPRGTARPEMAASSMVQHFAARVGFAALARSHDVPHGEGLRRQVSNGVTATDAQCARTVSVTPIAQQLQCGGQPE